MGFATSLAPSPLATHTVFQIKSSYEFHFEGLWNFRASVEGLIQIQDINLRISKWNIKVVLNLCMNYMIHVSNILWRIKNQSLNSTSWSDNTPRLFILVAVFQDSKMSFQSMNSVQNPVKLTLTKASSVSRLSLVLLFALNLVLLPKTTLKDSNLRAQWRSRYCGKWTSKWCQHNQPSTHHQNMTKLVHSYDLEAA